MDKDMLIFFGAIVGIGSVIGALAGLGLSFTALSPLIIGGIVAGVLIAVLAIGARYYFRNDINEAKEQGNFVEKRAILASAPLVGITLLTDIAIGVGIAAGVNAILPGIFATWWATAAGAVIGAAVLPIIAGRNLCCVHV